MGKSRGLSAGCASRTLAALSQPAASNFSRQPRLRRNVPGLSRQLHHHRVQNESARACDILRTYSPLPVLLSEGPAFSQLASMRPPASIMPPPSERVAGPKTPPLRPWSPSARSGLPMEGVLASVRSPDPIVKPGSTEPPKPNQPPQRPRPWGLQTTPLLKNSRAACSVLPFFSSPLLGPSIRA